MRVCFLVHPTCDRKFTFCGEIKENQSGIRAFGRVGADGAADRGIKYNSQGDLVKK